MTRLAWWLVRAQFLSRRTATALSMLAIALGVALGYAIHLINAAALADFSQAMQGIQGEPDAVIVARDSAGHVPHALIDEVARDEAVALVAPVIETRVRLGREATTAKLIGIDIFSAAVLMPALLPREGGAGSGGLFDGGLYASQALLESTGLRVPEGTQSAGADTTAIRGESRWKARVAGDLPAMAAGERILVADIAWVQLKK